MCDCNKIAAGTDDRTLDLTAGFDPRITPRRRLAASAVLWHLADFFNTPKTPPG